MQETHSFDWLEHGVLPITTSLFTTLAALLVWLFVTAVFGLPHAWWMPLWLVFLASGSTFAFQWNRLVRGPESLGTVVFLLTVAGTLLGSYLATRAPISVAAYVPWIAAPLLAVWVGAGMGRNLAGITKLVDQVGDQGATTLAWEQEGVRYSIGPFFGAMMGWLVLAGVLTGASVGFFGAHSPAFTATTAGLVISGLLLQGFSYLHRLRVIWRLQHIAVHPRLAQRWLQSCVLLSSILTALVLLLPANWLRIPWGSIGQWVSNRLQFSGAPSGPADTPQVPPPPTDMPLHLEEAAEPHWLTMIAYGLLFLMTIAMLLVPILALVGFVILYFKDEEAPKLPLLLALPAFVYQQVWRIFLWAKRELALWRRHLQKAPLRSRSTTMKTAAEPFHNHVTEKESFQGLELNGLYQRLRERAKRQGAPILPGTGPRRTAQYIHELAPSLYQTLAEFFRLVVRGRYSKEVLPSDHLDRAKELYATIEEGLEREEPNE